MKLNSDFMEHVTIDLPIVELTTKAVCVRFQERLCAISFSEGQRVAYIPPNESLSKYTVVRIKPDGTIIKFFKSYKED